MGDFQIMGSSTEILVRQEQAATAPGAASPAAAGDKPGEKPGQIVTVRPIAGTRPRGATPEQDKALEASW